MFRVVYTPQYKLSIRLKKQFKSRNFPERGGVEGPAQIDLEHFFVHFWVRSRVSTEII